MLKKLLKSMVHRWKAPPQFTGPYATWAEAKSHSTGYDAEMILEKTRISSGKVRDGEAPYERDSVVFERVFYSYALLAGLLRASSEFGNRLTVLDFGGSLGSSYYQCRAFLETLTELRWWVVEQEKHVDCGKREFSNEELRFAYSVEEVLQQARPDVLLLSSVIQYLENPHAMLDYLLSQKVPYLILDRTPFLTKTSKDLLSIHHVPSSIYKASYPQWHLGYYGILKQIEVNYTILAEFEAQPYAVLHLGDVTSATRGLIARHHSIHG
jgi:putative methyltransferase (TIGR04325 family)